MFGARQTVAPGIQPATGNNAQGGKHHNHSAEEASSGRIRELFRRRAVGHFKQKVCFAQLFQSRNPPLAKYACKITHLKLSEESNANICNVNNLWNRFTKISVIVACNSQFLSAWSRKAHQEDYKIKHGEMRRFAIRWVANVLHGKAVIACAM